MGPHKYNGNNNNANNSNKNGRTKQPCLINNSTFVYFCLHIFRIMLFFFLFFVYFTDTFFHSYTPIHNNGIFTSVKRRAEEREKKNVEKKKKNIIYNNMCIKRRNQNHLKWKPPRIRIQYKGHKVYYGLLVPIQ